jgi:hypothetical protein
MALPKREAEAEPWQIAMEQLIDAAEGRYRCAELS